MIKRKQYKGVLLGFTVLLLFLGIRGYYPRYNDPLQEDSPSTLPSISEGNYPVLLILAKSTGNPSEALEKPLYSFSKLLTSGMSGTLPLSELKEEVKKIALRAFPGSVDFIITATYLIFPFHYFF